MDDLRAVVDELASCRAALDEIARLLAAVGPEEVLDQDIPAEQGRRWIISHDVGLNIVQAYRLALNARRTTKAALCEARSVGRCDGNRARV